MNTAQAPDTLPSDTPTDPTSAKRPTTRRVRIGVDALDAKILNLTLRFAMLRAVHYYQFLGGSPHTIRKHLGGLVERGLLAQALVPVSAATRWNDIASCTDHIANVYVLTTEGRKLIRPWEPVGYPAGTILNLSVADKSTNQPDHQLGLVDLAAWYTRFGFRIASEREIRSLETEGVRGAGERAYPQPGGMHWTTQLAGRVGKHPPDLGVIDTAGNKWAVELERATKDVTAYQALIAAYYERGMGQVWHVNTNATANRLIQACKLIGIELVKDGHVMRSTDEHGLVRLQMWVPGPTWTKVPTTGWYVGVREQQGNRTVVTNRWPANMTIEAPGQIAAVTRMDDDALAATWRRGRPVDLTAVDLTLTEEGGWWN